MDDDTKNEEISDLEWQKRVLCSDESCIGTIGEDGRCRECGKLYEGELPAADPAFDNTSHTQASPTAVLPEQGTSADPSPQSDDDAEQDNDSDWDNRTLCSDESCIGVIGADGRCKECGRPLA